MKEKPKGPCLCGRGECPECGLSEVVEKRWDAYAVHLLGLVDALNEKLHDIEEVTGGHGLTLAKAQPESFGLTKQDVDKARKRFSDHNLLY